jgi:branched-chain amino acid transport system ATP-binding protein
MARLAVNNLHATYRNTNSNEVLRGVGFSLDARQLLLVHGHNGSGKSTLLKALAGVIPVTSGTVAWEGRPDRGGQYGRPTWPWVGFQMQAGNVFDGLSVRENVSLVVAGRGLPSRAAEQTVQERFAMLRPIWDKRAGLLSGGQRKVLALAMATLGDPPLLLLDEPMAGLSDESASAVLGCLEARKAAGTILIIVEHSMDRLRNGLIDLHAEMIEGRLGTPTKLPAGLGMKGNVA